MEVLLSKVTQQAMNYAIRSGITITSGFAISQCSRLMKTQEGKEREELASLQRRLESKIKIISPAIDMIELLTARGNTSLESCVSMTKSIRLDIQNLGTRLANAVADEELSLKKSNKAKAKVLRDQELKYIVFDMRALLQRIEDAVPLINLAITTSGVSLSTNLSASISPSRLLQASTFLSAGDVHYVTQMVSQAQIGPTFTLSMYMLFTGHANRIDNEEGLHHTTWQEVMHKSRVKLVRLPISRLGTLTTSYGMDDKQSGKETTPDHIAANVSTDEFAYQLNFIEDLNDGRVHTVEDDQPEPDALDDVEMAGIREAVPIHEISKIFYADTGKILNIGNEGEMNNPVLLLKRDINAVPPRRMMEQHSDDDDIVSNADDATVGERTDVANPTSQQNKIENSVQSKYPKVWRLPPGLDPEWIALEVFADEPDSDSESESGADTTNSFSRSDCRRGARESSNGSVTTRMSDLTLSSPPPDHKTEQNGYSTRATVTPATTSTVAFGAIRTSLSLLEMLIRLTSLQQFQQASHLTINDELLNFFLEESSTTGAVSGDTEERKRIRQQARQKVGFDPYNESPIKRRGEQYQYDQNADWNPSGSSPWADTDRTSASPASAQSPLLLRSREHSSPSIAGQQRTVSGRAATSPGSDITPLRQSFASLATPPGTTKSRERIMRSEKSRGSRQSDSPLAKYEAAPS